MKKIVKKRIVLYCPWTQETIIGAEEYDRSLSDDNILNAYHETYKTRWCQICANYKELWYLKEYGEEYGYARLPHYRVMVERFYTYVPSFWDKLKNALR